MKKKVWTIVGGKKTQNDPSSKSLEREKGDFSIQFGEKTKTYTSSEKQCKVPTCSR